MRILFTPSGTDGDVRPTSVLAEYFRQRGHDVLFCAPPNSLDFLKELGFISYPLSMDYKEFSTGIIREVLKNPSAKGKLFVSFIREDTAGQFESIEKLVDKADMIISSGLNFSAPSIAECYNKKFYHILHIPEALPTRYFPPMIAPCVEYPPFINQLLWKLNGNFFNYVVLKQVNQWREKHCLKPIKGVYESITSKNIISADADISRVGQDVQTHYHQTGYWHVHSAQAMETELLEFLDSGPKPIYLGFGSMAGNHEDTLIECLPDLAQSLNIRFIICSGWGYKKLESLKYKNIYVTGFVPHSKLFPKVAAAIHHGAAGTTHAAALAGIPQVLIPHRLDQFGWALKIEKKGLGPKAFNAISFSRDKIYKVLNQLLSNQSYFSNAEILGEKLQGIDRTRELEELYDWIMG